MHSIPWGKKVAVLLIENLPHAGNLKKAATIAQLILNYLKDLANDVDQESVEVANASSTLARLIFELNVDQSKAEMLVRESLCIRMKVYGNNHVLVGQCLNILVNKLLSLGKLEEETERFLERNLANAIRNEGADGLITTEANSSFGRYHYELSVIIHHSYRRRNRIIQNH
jgi:hypothetical protein